MHGPVALSSADALPSLGAARRAGVDISAETCPHYLTFDAEHIMPGSTAFKCAPPIREARHREGLWAGLAAGDVHLSAASPCVDAGDPAYVPLPGETDFDGQARVFGPAIDMGADEFHP